MKTSTITLTVDEFRSLMAIDSRAEREELAETIAVCATDPDRAPANPDNSIAAAIAERTRLRRERARRAAERRKARRLEMQAAGKKAPADKNLKTKEFELQLTDGIIRRLLWINQHYNEWIDQVTRTLTMFDHWELGDRTASIVRDVTDSISRILRPLAEMAVSYMKLPRRERPRSMEIALPVA